MWLFDLGNTRLKLARVESGTLGEVAAIEFERADWLDQVARRLAAHPPAPAWVASVTGAERGERLRELLRSGGQSVEWVGPPASDGLLVLAYANPASFGVDRWLALRALRRDLRCAFVLANVGTALTVDSVDDHGRHLGGVIAPSPERAREALLQRAPHLRGVSGRVDPFASSTADGVESGAVLAAAALIERIHSEAEHRLDHDVALVLCGGGSDRLQPWIHAPLLRRDNLVLQGLLDRADGQDRAAVVAIGAAARRS